MKPSWALRNWKPQLRSRLIDGKYIYIYIYINNLHKLLAVTSTLRRGRERERERGGHRDDLLDAWCPRKKVNLNLSIIYFLGAWIDHSDINQWGQRH